MNEKNCPEKRLDRAWTAARHLPARHRCRLHLFWRARTNRPGANQPIRCQFDVGYSGRDSNLSAWNIPVG